MSADITSSSPLPELPPEIWLKIFRIATFIYRETDVSATTVEPGLFCSFDKYQSRAFEVLLPLRRTIVQVSRRFYQIGAEVLYTTFQASSPRIKYSPRRLQLFSDLLVSRPELGRFVKRLSLQWSVADEETNYRIIARCPNVVIFPSLICPSDLRGVPWWGRGLSKTIRSLDAVMSCILMVDILSLLENLPHLEILHLWGLRGDSIPQAPICLSTLRILSIYLGPFPDAINCRSPILSMMRLPRLTALVTNLSNLETHLSFPLDDWRRLEYFKLDKLFCVKYLPTTSTIFVICASSSMHMVFSAGGALSLSTSWSALH